jgi:hypothetical protein
MAGAVNVLCWYTHIAGTCVRGLYSHIEIVLGKQSILETGNFILLCKASEKLLRRMFRRSTDFIQLLFGEHLTF